MNKMCMVGYNFGEKYQGFIPFYIYSTLKAYPEYDVLVFSGTKINQQVKRSLILLEGMGNFEVIENYDFGVNFEDILDYGYYKQALRWLFYDERFEKYESLYIGDIDILILKEEDDIYTQHMKHCKVLDLPYSNYRRAIAKKESFSIKEIVYYTLTLNKKMITRKLNKNVILENRLSGLHFIKTSEYYRKVKPFFNSYLNILTGKEIRNDLFNDEAILFDLIEKSGVGLPPVSPNSPDLDNKNAENIAFRPHHGIHLGIFKNKKTQMNQRQVLQSYVYKNYYSQYSELKNNDSIFIELLNYTSPFTKRIFDNMENYYFESEDSYNDEKK